MNRLHTFVYTASTRICEERNNHDFLVVAGGGWWQTLARETLALAISRPELSQKVQFAFAQCLYKAQGKTFTSEFDKDMAAFLRSIAVVLKELAIEEKVVRRFIEEVESETQSFGVVIDSQ